MGQNVSRRQRYLSFAGIARSQSIRSYSECGPIQNYTVAEPLNEPRAR